MTSHRQKSAMKAAHPCFVSYNVLGATPVFSHPEPCQKVTDIWRQMQQQKGLTIYGFLLLEDLVYLLGAGDDFALLMRHFREESARQVLQCLEQLDDQGLLKRLRRFQDKQQSDPAAQLWQPAGPIEPVLRQEMMRAKLEMIHQTPVKRGYVTDPVLYRYCSARNYAGQPGLLQITTDW